MYLIGSRLIPKKQSFRNIIVIHDCLDQLFMHCHIHMPLLTYTEWQIMFRELVDM